jgi:hypothetical protein
MGLSGTLVPVVGWMIPWMTCYGSGATKITAIGLPFLVHRKPLRHALA